MFLLQGTEIFYFTEFTEGNSCRLHTGAIGICKNALKCNWAIENLKRRQMRLNDIRRCSFSVSFLNSVLFLKFSYK